MIAVDLGRDADGTWRVISDRTQAPSGAGYAMQNRRVVSRVLPEVYHAAHLHRLTPFFQAMRTALLDAAPQQVEDPRVVVLSPGTHSETAFDQAFLASLLGFPLLEGSDLTVRDGRVWMRVLGKLEQVDVILRRVDSVWMDALGAEGRIAPGGDRAGRVRPAGQRQRGQRHRFRASWRTRRCCRSCRDSASGCWVNRFGCRRSTPGGAAIRTACPRARPPRRPGDPADQPGSGSQRPRRRA